VEAYAIHRAWLTQEKGLKAMLAPNAPRPVNKEYKKTVLFPPADCIMYTPGTQTTES
jgi:hypothetical protein